MLASLRKYKTQQRLASVLGDEYFHGDLVHIRRAIREYWKRTGKKAAGFVIPMGSLRVLARDAAGKRWKAVSNILDRLGEVPCEHDQAIEQHLSAYMRREGLRRLALEISNSIDDNSIDPAAIRRRLDDLCFGPEESGDRTAALSSAPATYMRELRRRRVPTGIHGIDRILGGGLGLGELGLVIAPYGRGKTTVLVNFGVHAARLGRRVFHLSLELSKAQTMMRYDMCAGLLTNKQLTAPAVMRARKRLTAAGGDVVVRDSSHERITPSRLEGFIAQYGPFDLVLLDYADLMRADERDVRRYESTQVYEDLRRLGNAVPVPIWTAAQANRWATKAEEEGEAWSGSDVAEDINKMRICDHAVLVFDSEPRRAYKRIVLKVDKTRMHHTKPSFGCRADFERMQISELIGGDEEDATSLRSRKAAALSAVHQKEKNRKRPKRA